MKKIKLLLVLILTLAVTLTSLTSCEQLEELGIELPFGNEDATQNETPDDTNETPNDTNETPDDVVDPTTCAHYVTTVKNKVSPTCSKEGYTGDTVCYACGTVVKAGRATAKTEHNFKDGKCTACGEVAPENQFDKIREEWASNYETITIAEALTLCEQFVDAPSTDRYYIIATVKSVDNTSYGQLTIEDETGSIMVYGTNSSDGSLKYDKMGVELKAGDLVLLYGTLQNYNGSTKEVQNAWLIDHQAGVVVPPSVDFESGDTITVEDAIAIAGKVAATDYFYIKATVVSVTNANFGAMIIADETGEISVYNSKSADGVDYSAMTDKPYKGDTVLIKATGLQSFSGTPEIKQAYIVEFTHNEPDINPDDYTLTTIADARLLTDGTTVKVEGVVARITYADGMIPAGFYLIDSTGSIYVYDGELAARVAIGNTVTIVGAKDHWILETEQSNANKFGYQGCNQITDCVLVSNDNGSSDFDKSWITESTVKNIVETPVSEDISTIVYKVNALVKEVPGSGFTNFYFFDLDGETSSYAYSQCSGSDFAWLREFDGKICTVYLSALNAKSTAGDCFWRFIPVAVVDEGYTFDVANAPKFALDYYAKDQFLGSYTADPELGLINSVSSELLGFENVLISYSSSNEEIGKFTTDADGNVVFNLLAYGEITVTITATYGDYTETTTVTVKYEEAAEYDFISVEEAINAEVGQTVTVKGIVGPSLVNKVGFYLMGENGLIAVLTTSDVMSTLEIGHEVIIEAVRHNNTKGGTTYYGQTCLKDAVVLVNNQGNHAYNDSYFVTGKTLADLSALDVTVDYTTSVYVVTAKVEYVETAYYTTLKLTYGGAEFSLYMSGAGQYSWLSEFAGQEVTIEMAICNWNDKTYYRGCVLSVITDDGKVYNTLNFDAN